MMSNLISKRLPDKESKIFKRLKDISIKWAKFVICCFVAMVLIIPCTQAFADNAVNVNIDGSDQNIIEIIVLLTILALLPSIVIMMTAFTRIVIVLSFLRNALGTQQSPPNQVLIGIALFLTLFVMSPVINQINDTAYKPYQAEEITQAEFIERAQVPLKDFMLKQTKTEDLNLFIDMSGTTLEEGQDAADLSLTVIIPSFITSELKRAFLIGFLLYIPFLIIDMIVASALMSMGMMMLPPSMISLPFKLLLFVLVDGWGLLFKSLVMSFNT